MPDIWKIFQSVEFSFPSPSLCKLLTGDSSYVHILDPIGL